MGIPVPGLKIEKPFSGRERWWRFRLPFLKIDLVQWFTFAVQQQRRQVHVIKDGTIKVYGAATGVRMVGAAAWIPGRRLLRDSRRVPALQIRHHGWLHWWGTVHGQHILHSHTQVTVPHFGNHYLEGLHIPHSNTLGTVPHSENDHLGGAPHPIFPHADH
jgi:hypothetical protein